MGTPIFDEHVALPNVNFVAPGPGTYLVQGPGGVAEWRDGGYGTVQLPGEVSITPEQARQREMGGASRDRADHYNMLFEQARARIIRSAPVEEYTREHEPLTMSQKLVASIRDMRERNQRTAMWLFPTREWETLRYHDRVIRSGDDFMGCELTIQVNGNMTRVEAREKTWQPNRTTRW